MKHISNLKNEISEANFHDWLSHDKYFRSVLVKISQVIHKDGPFFLDNKRLLKPDDKYFKSILKRVVICYPPNFHGECKIDYGGPDPIARVFPFPSQLITETISMNRLYVSKDGKLHRDHCSSLYLKLCQAQILEEKGFLEVDSDIYLLILN